MPNDVPHFLVSNHAEFTANLDQLWAAGGAWLKGIRGKRDGEQRLQMMHASLCPEGITSLRGLPEDAVNMIRELALLSFLELLHREQEQSIEAIREGDE